MEDRSGRLPGIHRGGRQGSRLLRGRVSAGDALGEGIALIAVALLVPVLAGCGDDAQPAAPSKSDFVAEANAICDEQAKLIAAVGVELGESPTSDEVDAFVKETFVPAVRDEVARIRSLGLPPADSNRLQGVLFDIEAVLDELTTNPDEVLAAGTTPFDDINRRLDEYGLTACGSGTAASSSTTSTVAT